MQDTIEIAELEDKNVVYLIGLPTNLSDDVIEWFYSDKFDEYWNETFSTAQYLLLPAGVNGVGEIDVEVVEELAELVEEMEEASGDEKVKVEDEEEDDNPKKVIDNYADS